MGFLSGSTTFERYWVTHDPTSAFGTDHLDSLERFKIGAFETNSLEQPDVGFIAGDHLLDTNFDLEKNVIGEAMHFGIRIDSHQIPAAVRKAWLQMELLPLIVDNPSGRPTKAQRQEAHEAVEAKCDEEVRTGRFRRMQQTPILWDALSETLYIGGTSASVNEICVDLLQRAFGIELDRITSGKLAHAYATENKKLDGLYEVCPSRFQADDASVEISWWNGMAENFDYLGNEFLLWLWWHWETKSDTVQLADDSAVAGMFARTLNLDCPAGTSGKETISADSPVSLPEAALAIRSGKLPRKAGLTLVRQGEQYEFAVQAETFSVSGAKITQMGEDSDTDKSRETRLDSVRSLSETLDLLFQAFCEKRIGKAWKRELKQIRDWLHVDTRPAKRKPAA